MTKARTKPSRLLALAGSGLLGAAALALPSAAQAYWWGGVWVAPPPAPYYYPPPAYAPPPAYPQYPPPAQSQAPANAPLGYICYAGVYTCRVPWGPIGSGCSCPGLGAPSYGTIG